MITLCVNNYTLKPFVVEKSELFCSALVAKAFREAAKKTSGNGGTESHFYAVDVTMCI